MWNKELHQVDLHKLRKLKSVPHSSLLFHTHNRKEQTWGLELRNTGGTSSFSWQNVCVCAIGCVFDNCLKLRRGSSMVWTIPLSFISLFHSLSLSVPLPDNSKSRVLLLIFHALLCFLNIPSPPRHFRCFTAAGILFSSYRSTYANFWLDIIWNGA